MAKSKDQDQFSPKEAQQRFEAALRGSRITGHKSLADVRRDNAKSKAAPSPKRKKK